MLTRTNIKNGDQLSVLGFGCMRFPKRGGGIDEARAMEMIYEAIARGVNYFDTAYIYHGGKSEVLLGKALVGAYRKKVWIADKLPIFMVGSLPRAKKIFATQLERLQTDYIDYYLLHMLVDKAMLDRFAAMGIIDWLEELKAAGTIRNIGFSFHGTKAEFEEIVRAYPWDFCQIQYNYLDENNQAGKSGLLLAASLGIPVIVMEPLRGGKLVTSLPQSVKKAFAEHHAKWSPAEWGLRWVWNHPEVTVVLSGMSDEEQLAENSRIADDAYAGSLSHKESAVFEQVREEIVKGTKIPCTACAYCLPCPYGVDIPGCFSCYNDKYLLDDKRARFRYLQTMGVMAQKPSYASLCRGCGKCEEHCPQNIAIRDELKNVSREMEGLIFKPLVAIVRKFMKVK